METINELNEKTVDFPSTQKKRGPKPKAGDERLDYVVRLRLNEKHYNELVKQLDPLKRKNKINIGDLIRQMIFPKSGSKIKKLMKAQAQESSNTNQEIIDMTNAILNLIQQIKKIGVNINQVVFKINGMEYAPNVKEQIINLEEMRGELQKIIDQCKTHNEEISKWYQY